MANTDKNIIITPSIGSSTADPTIVFTGGNTTVANSINMAMYASGTLSWSGTAGQLFSITNSLTGTIFAVNDISGIPSITVNSLGNIVLAQYNGNVTIGASQGQASNVLSVAGNLYATGNSYVAQNQYITGNIVVLGSNDLFNGKVGIGTSTITGANSNVLAVYGTTQQYGNIALQSQAAGGAGIYFADGTFQTTAGAAPGNYSNTNVASYLSGPVQVGNLTINNTTASTSTVTGALLMGGGAGIQGSVNIGGNLSVALASQLSFVIASNSIVASSMTSNGAIQSAGTATVNALASNGAVSGTTGTFTGALYGASFNTAGTATVNALTSNGAVSGTTGTFTGALYGASFNTAGTATVNALASNGAVSGTTGTFTGALYGASFNTAGTATVNALASNGAITGTTITGTAGTFTSLQNSGTTTTNALSSNVYGVFGQNVAVNSTNASTAYTAGALIVAGGVGINGNLNVNGANNLFSNKVGIGTSVILGARANVLAVYGTENLYGNLIIANTTSGGSGIYFPDGTYQQTAGTIGGINQSVQYNNNGVFGGDTDFLYDNVNKRLGIGTISLTNSLTVFSATPALFSTTNGADQQIIVGNSNTSSYGTVVGYNSSAGSGLNTYGYISFVGAASKNISVTSGKTGIGGITIPQNTLEIGGTTVIGGTFAGNNNFINPPSNGLAVQGSVGIGTFTPLSTLDVNGIISARTAFSTGGTATVNALSSNTNVVGVNLQSTGLASVSSMIANTNITTSTLNATSNVIVASLNSNTNVVATNVQSTGLASVASLIANANIFGATLNTSGLAQLSSLIANANTTTATLNSTGLAQAANFTSNGYTTTATLQSAGLATVNQLISNANIYGANINIGGPAQLASLIVNVNTTTATLNVTGAAQVNSLISNAGIYSANLNIAGAALVNSLNSNTNVVGVNLQSTGLATVNQLISNANIFGANINISGAAQVSSLIGNTNVFGATLQSSGQAQLASLLVNANTTSSTLNVQNGAIVNSLTSNGAITGTTVTGTAATFTSLQVSGTTTTNALVGNVYGVFGQNVTINSTNAASTTSATTGALVVAGGAGIASGLTTTGFVNFIGSGSLEYTLRIKGSSTGDQFAIATNGTAGYGVANDALNAAGTAYTPYAISASNVTIKTGASAPAAALTLTNYGNAVFAQNLTVNSTNTSTSTTTGALIIAGGIGVAGNVYAGSNVVAASFQPTSASIPGAGLYLPTTNALSLSTSGSERIRIDANGNVGVGTPTPTSYVGSGMAVIGTNAATQFYAGSTTGGIAVSAFTGSIFLQATGANDLYVGSAGAANAIFRTISLERMRIDTTGNVGIGSATSITGSLFVRDITSNAGITATTLTLGGTATVNALVSNVYGLFGQNVTVNSTNASTSTATGALVVAGGIGAAGNLFVGGNITTTGTSGNISGVNNISTVSMTASGNINISGSRNTFTNYVGIGTSTAIGINSNVFTVYGTAQHYGNIVLQNQAAGVAGIYFADGTFQTTAATGSGSGNYSNTNVASYLSGPVQVGNLTINNTTASTSTVTGALLMGGGAGIQGAVHVGGLIYGASTLNIAGAAQVNSLTSNGAVSGTTGTFTSALYGASFNTAGTATVNALVSNGAVSGTNGTFTSALYGASFNTAGTATVNALVSNGAVSGTTGTFTGALYGASFNTAGTATVNALTSNGAVSGTAGTFTGALYGGTVNSAGAAIVNSLNSNTNVVATNIQSTGQATVASLVSNGAVSGTTGTFTGALYGGSFNTAGTATVNALAINGAVSGTTGTFTGALYGGTVNSAGAAIVNSLNSNTNIVATNIQSTGQATVASLVSNGAISGTTITGTTGTFTSIQNSGTTLVQSLNSNTNVVATNIQSTGQATVASLVSNGAISGTTITGTTGTFTSIQNSGTTTTNALVSNVYGLFGQNVTVNSANASTAISNGALIITTGGAGIAGNVNAGGSRSLFTGAIGIGTSTAAGMIAAAGVSNDAYHWGNVRIANTATTSSGIVFSDGTIQNSAASPTAATVSFGTAGTIQFAGAGNTFLGDTTNFFWDDTNNRLGIGTSTPGQTISAYSAEAVLFNTKPGGGARQEITVGNVTTYGAVLGYDPSVGNSIGYLRRGDSAASTPALAWAYGTGAYRIGVNGITQPQNTMDINGTVAIGNGFSGLAAMTNTNGLSVQGSVGIGTFTPLSTLDVNGIISARTAFSTGGTATVNALVGNVYGLFGQNVTVNSTNTSTATTNGALVVAGGIGAAGNINIGGSRNLFTNSIGIGTSTATGINSNVFTIYGTAQHYGNIVIGNTTAGGSGIYFPDGTFLNTAVNTYTTFNYTGNGSTTGYSTSPITASSINNTMVFVNGVYQRKSTYSWSGTTLTFSSAPPNFATIEINCVQALNAPYGVSDLTVSGTLGVGGSAIGTFKSSVTGAALGTVANSQSPLLTLYNSDVGNASYLEFTDVRNATGGVDWTTAGKRIQQKIDATYMGWVGFNNGNTVTTNNGGISFGTGLSTLGPNGVPEVMRITSTGTVGIATVTPGSTLDVNGVISARTAFSTAGSASVASVTSNGTVTGTAFVPSSATIPTNGMYLPSATSLGWAVSSTSVMTLTKNGTNATANLAVTGNITATGEVTAYYSDVRLKDNITLITNAMGMLSAINGVYYNPSRLAESLLHESRHTSKVGLIAQEVEAVLPHVIRSAPFDTNTDGSSKSGENYKTIQYEKVIPLLVEAIKEQQRQIDQLESKISALEKIVE